MNLYFRLIYLLIKSLFRKSQPHTKILDETVLKLMVLPNDLDLNWHMNNGRYLTLMDLGRIDFMQRIDLLNTVIKNKWFPVLSASQMTFLRPLKLFERYTLHTSLEHWDEKWYVISQRFERNGKVYAIGKVRGLFRDKDGTVNCNHVLDHFEGSKAITPPPLAPETEIWINYLEKSAQSQHTLLKKK